MRNGTKTIKSLRKVVYVEHIKRRNMLDKVTFFQEKPFFERVNNNAIAIKQLNARPASRGLKIPSFIADGYNENIIPRKTDGIRPVTCRKTQYALIAIKA